MTTDDVAWLACPACRAPVRWSGAVRDGALSDGTLRCTGCRRGWPVVDGLPHLLDETLVRRDDRWMRLIYDAFAMIHDPAVRYLLPLFQGSTEDDLRSGYMRRLELDRLVPNPDGTPARILEVGIGCGANLPLIERALPPTLPAEIWGLDISTGMLSQCRRRLARVPARPVTLMLADAHALPFPEASFDRVFHVGGIAAFGDPRLALAEMARVARPGTPIVVVDEQLDPRRSHALYYRVAYALLTAIMPADGSPAGDLPPGAVDVLDEQVSRFYYSLRFRMPNRVNRSFA
jgi:ubiquinone/menaquinone biosynthesis C-methylase UbiE/uncharacterized protein YbaR (Trm112 family)